MRVLGGAKGSFSVHILALSGFLDETWQAVSAILFFRGLFETLGCPAVCSVFFCFFSFFLSLCCACLNLCCVCVR